MKELSEKCRAWMLSPWNKSMIDELLAHHSNYINNMRDLREDLAKEAGMTYKEFMQKIETEAKELGHAFSQG